VATIFGVALWNSLLIGVGYAGAFIDDSANASAVAVKVVFILLVGEGVAAAAWRGVLVRRGTTTDAIQNEKLKCKPKQRG
jgi:membrane protein DedA with SNARE-associated domain